MIWNKWMDGWCVCLLSCVCVKLFNLFWGNFVSISFIMNVWFYLFFFLVYYPFITVTLTLSFSLFNAVKRE